MNTTTTHIRKVEKPTYYDGPTWKASYAAYLTTGHYNGPEWETVYKSINKYIIKNVIDDYDVFVDRYMEKYLHPEMNETDEEFDERCKIAWKKLLTSDVDEETIGYNVSDWISNYIETDKDRAYMELQRKLADDMCWWCTGCNKKVKETIYQHKDCE